MVGWPEASHGYDLATVTHCQRKVVLWFIRGHESVVG